MRTVDIFPWNDYFNTGLPEIDGQHRALLGLLNELARHIAFASNLEELNLSLAELLGYIKVHFAGEERLWDKYITDEEERRAHHQGHQTFLANMARLQAKQGSRAPAEVVDETLSSLSRWLVSHLMDQDRYAAHMIDALQAGKTQEEARNHARRKMEGSEQYLQDMVRTIYSELSTNTVNLLRQIDERKQAEIFLHDSEERFRTIVEEAPVGVILHRDGHVIQVNEAAVRMFRYPSLNDMLRTIVFDNIAPENRAEVQDLARRRLRGEDVELMYETVGLRQDGSRFPLVLAPRRMQTAEGPVIGAFLLDITERKRAEETERRLHRAIKLLSRINALQLRVTDERALLDGVCRLCIEVGGFMMAWVGYARHDANKTVEPVAHYGDNDHYLESVQISWSDTPHGRGPAGNAIRSGKHAISGDITKAPEMSLWREGLAQRGYQAAAALPLKVDGNVIGVLVMYSGNVEHFHDEEVALLDELAADLSFGIQALRLRAAKEAAVRALERESNKNRALLHNASDGVHILDSQGYLIDASDSFFEMLGYRRSELMGNHLTVWDVLGQESWQDLEPAYRKVFNSGTRQELQLKHRRRDGSLIDVSVSTFPVIIEGQRLLFNSSRDITESLRTRKQLEQTTDELRHLLAEFESSLEAERSHIAREVHDELGQILTSLGFTISTIRVKFGKDNQELRELVGEMAMLNDRALHVARNVAENLRPAMLDMGIVPAIEWLCDRTREQTGLRCDFHASDNLGEMSQDQVDAVFRIVQESMTNAVRHAVASCLSISLTRHEDGLHLTVHDDGKGFEPGRNVKPKSFGLRGMGERVRALGGEFRVTSAPDAGTTIAVHIPYLEREVVA